MPPAAAKLAGTLISPPLLQKPPRRGLRRAFQHFLWYPKAATAQSISDEALSNGWLREMQAADNTWACVRDAGLCGSAAPRGVIFTLMLKWLFTYKHEFEPCQRTAAAELATCRSTARTHPRSHAMPVAAVRGRSHPAPHQPQLLQLPSNT